MYFVKDVLTANPDCCRSLTCLTPKCLRRGTGGTGIPEGGVGCGRRGGGGGGGILNATQSPFRWFALNVSFILRGRVNTEGKVTRQQSHKTVSVLYMTSEEKGEPKQTRTDWRPSAYHPSVLPLAQTGSVLIVEQELIARKTHSVAPTTGLTRQYSSLQGHLFSRACSLQSASKLRSWPRGRETITWVLTAFLIMVVEKMDSEETNIPDQPVGAWRDK